MTKDNNSSTVELNDRDLDAVYGGAKITAVKSDVITQKTTNKTAIDDLQGTTTTKELSDNPGDYNLGDDFAP